VTTHIHQITEKEWEVRPLLMIGYTLMKRTLLASDAALPTSSVSSQASSLCTTMLVAQHMELPMVTTHTSGKANMSTRLTFMQEMPSMESFSIPVEARPTTMVALEALNTLFHLPVALTLLQELGAMKVQLQLN